MRKKGLTNFLKIMFLHFIYTFIIRENMEEKEILRDFINVIIKTDKNVKVKS